MKRFIRMLLAVVAAVTFSLSVQAVRADADEVTGEIFEVDRELSIVVILPEGGQPGQDEVTIIGFPFHNLEMQLCEEIFGLQDPGAQGITIGAGDCVTVTYVKKELSTGDVVNKWLSLTMYCEAAECCKAEEDCIDEECCMDDKCNEDCYCYAEALIHDTRLTHNNRNSEH